MEFQEKHKIDLAIFDSTGATAETISQYFDMLGHERIDFLVQTRFQLPTTLTSTLVEQGVIRLLQASGATGAGATAISSATAVVGRSVKNCVSLADKANEIYIQFTTLASGATFSVAGYQYSYDSTADATARVMNSTGATAAASVASELFVTNFNSTANNPLATVWAAATVASALVKISPFNVDAQATYLTATGSTLVNVGMGKCVGHLGLDAKFMKDGCRYVAIGFKSSNANTPVAAMAIRTAISNPVNQWAVSASKSMAGSTSK
jgi:hypothetical protein